MQAARSPSLAAKATSFEYNLEERHWLEGLYVSLVRIEPGGPPDHSTAGFSEVGHAACWTGRYLAAQAFRYAVTREPEVRRRGGRVIVAMQRLHRITGKPGLLARGYLEGRGPTHEERTTDGREWRQGAGDLADLRWRGDVSTDNYHAVVWGYGVWHDLAADEGQKAVIREEVSALADHIIDHGYRIVDLDGQVTTWGDWRPERRSPMPQEERSLAWVLLLLALLKTAGHITGQPRYEHAYQSLVRDFWNDGHVPDHLSRSIDEGAELDPTNHSDELMAFEALYSLLRFEEEDRIRRVYLEILERLWEANREEGTPVLNFLYQAATGRDGRLADAQKTLRDYPVDRTIRPVMNSLRADIQLSPLKGRHGELQAVRPLPLGRRPLDNEFEWKANPYRVDDWHRICVTSAAAAVDLMAAVDSDGFLYVSDDGARTWRNVGDRLGAPARQVVALDAAPPVLLALTARGVLRSADAGSTWRHGRTPWQREAVLGASVAGRHFCALDDTRRLWIIAGPGWQPIGTLPFDGASALAVDPRRRATLYAAAPESGIWMTDDAGLHWRRLETPPTASPPRWLAHHPEQSGWLWAATESGEILSTRDGGQSWHKRDAILPVPPVTCLAIHADGSQLYLGAPGGLYCSRDEGTTWEETGLRLVVRGAPGRFETGSADYLLAYWMGRYFGYLDADDKEQPAPRKQMVRSRQARTDEEKHSTSARYPTVEAARTYYQRDDIAGAILSWCASRAAFLHHGPPLSDAAEEGAPLPAHTPAGLSAAMSDAFGDADPRHRPPLYPTVSVMPRGDCDNRRSRLIPWDHLPGSSQPTPDFCLECDPEGWYRSIREMMPAVRFVTSLGAHCVISYSGNRSLHLTIPHGALPPGGYSVHMGLLRALRQYGGLRCYVHLLRQYQVPFALHRLTGLVVLPLRPDQVEGSRPFHASLTDVTVPPWWQEPGEQELRRTREIVADLIAQGGKHQVAPPLRGWPSEPTDGQVRKTATRPPAGDRLAILLARAARQPDRDLRWRQVESALDLVRPGAPLPARAVARLLLDDDEMVRWAAAEVCRRTGPDCERALRLALTRARDWRGLRNAIHLAQELQLDGELAPLLAAARERVAPLEVLASIKYHDLDDEGRRAVLRRDAQRPDARPAARARMLHVIGAAGLTDLADVLTQALSSPDDIVRQSAVQALAMCSPDEIATRIESLASDPCPGVRAWAAWATGKGQRA